MAARREVAKPCPLASRQFRPSLENVTLKIERSGVFHFKDVNVREARPSRIIETRDGNELNVLRPFPFKSEGSCLNPILPFCEVRMLMCAVWVVPLIVLVRRLVFRPLTSGSFSTLFPRLLRWSVTVRKRMSLFAFRESAENSDLAFVTFAGGAPMECITHFAAMDIPVSDQRTRERLGWQPKQLELIADLDCSDYFQTTHFLPTSLLLLKLIPKLLLKPIPNQFWLDLGVRGRDEFLSWCMRRDL